MPTFGTYYCGFWEADPKKWLRCRQEAARQMVAEGWKTYANKFNRVMQKRALKLWSIK